MKHTLAVGFIPRTLAHEIFPHRSAMKHTLAVGFIPRTLAPEIFPCRIATPQPITGNHPKMYLSSASIP